MIRRLTTEQARRAAVYAQRLDRRRGTAPLRLLRQLGAVQIDSVNVLARAHCLPFFSRLDGVIERFKGNKVPGESRRREELHGQHLPDRASSGCHAAPAAAIRDVRRGAEHTLLLEAI